MVGIHGWSTTPKVPGLVSGVSRRTNSPLMYSSIRDQFPSGLIEEVTWYSLKAGIDCPDTGLRMVTLALFLGKLQAINPAVISRKTMISVIMVPFFITTFHMVVRLVIKTKKCAMSSPLRSTGKPYSVLDAHLSRRTVASQLMRSTRRSSEPSRLFLLFDLAPDGGCLAAFVAKSAGGLLHHLFTLTLASGMSLWPDP